MRRDAIIYKPLNAPSLRGLARRRRDWGSFPRPSAGEHSSLLRWGRCRARACSRRFCPCELRRARNARPYGLHFTISFVQKPSVPTTCRERPLCRSTKFYLFLRAIRESPLQLADIRWACAKFYRIFWNKCFIYISKNISDKF